jgi:hypothetical protein
VEQGVIWGLWNEAGFSEHGFGVGRSSHPRTKDNYPKQEAFSITFITTHVLNTVYRWKNACVIKLFFSLCRLKIKHATGVMKHSMITACCFSV